MTRRTFLIIDGYNLMHAAGIARQSYGPGDLERCRNRFLIQLSGLLTDTVQESCTVVFDAAERTADDTTGLGVARGSMRILFAAPGQDADSEIEDLIRTHSAPRQILIVSSDHRLHKAARRRRARCVDSEVFWSSLTDSDASTGHRRRASALPPEPAKEPLKQSADIPEEFLAIDVDQLQRDILKEGRPENRRQRGS